MKHEIRVLPLLAIILAVLPSPSKGAELELHHPEFHARLGMKISALIGDKGKTLSMKAVLKGPDGKTVLHEKQAPLAEQEDFILRLNDLNAGDYTLTVALSDGRKAERKWNKPYNGIPRVGIDENNAIRVAGKLFFPVFPWGVGTQNELEPFKACINTLNGVGFNKENYPLPGFKKVLDMAHKNGLMMIGPNRGTYWPKGQNGTRFYKVDGKKQRDRAADLKGIAEYTEAAKNHPALLFWNWCDEPELANGDNCIPPVEVRKWLDKCHEIDPQHPVYLNTGGGKFCRPKDNWGYKHIKNYTYMHAFEDRPALLGDVICQDYYPVKQCYDKNYPGSFEHLTVAMDEMVRMNRNLTPFGSFVETCVIPRGEKEEAPPTPTELRLMCWLNIIHGARMIGWFHYFNPTPPENFAEMTRFKEQITRLTPEVCTAVYPGVVTKKERHGGRVDFMANQTADGLFMAAAHWGTKEETVKFTLDFKPNTIVAIDENRTLSAEGKTFTDTFGPNEVHLYRVGKP